MLKHIVLLKLREDHDPNTLQAAIDKMNALPEQIPGIVSFAHGSNAGVTNDQYDYGVVAEFANKDDCLAYLSHPAHQALGGDFRELIASAAQFQFEH